MHAEQREMALISYELGLSAARRDGIEQGRVEGKAELLKRLLATKFGTLPPDIATRLGSAGDAELANWADRVLTAGTSRASSNARERSISAPIRPKVDRAAVARGAF